MKKVWEMPSIEDVNISKTSHDWTWVGKDGGYFGDGQISGHGSSDGKDYTQTEQPS